jgi:hypothetical protein
VWEDKSTTVNYEIFYTTKHSSGLLWSVPHNISESWDDSRSPAIGTDNSNNVHVVWGKKTPTNSEIFYATKPSGGSWPTPANISSNSGNSAVPDIATDSNSHLHVVWCDNTPGYYEIYYITSSDGISWSAPDNISHSSDNSVAPAIAIGSNLNVVWQEQVTASNQEIYYASAAIPTEGGGGGGGLSGGAIAGIVVGSCVAAGLIASS